MTDNLVSNFPVSSSQQPQQHSSKVAYDFSDCVDKRLNLAAFSSAEPLNTFVFGPEKEVDDKEQPKAPASTASSASSVSSASPDLSVKSTLIGSTLRSVSHSSSIASPPQIRNSGLILE